MVRSQVSLLRRQLNPLLTMLPLAMLGMAVLSDLAALISGVDFFAQVAYWDMAAGLLVGLLAFAVLLVDLVIAPAETHARRVLAVVSATSCAMLLLFAVVWSIRAEGDVAGNGFLVAAELLALGAGVAGACLARGQVLSSDISEAWPREAPPMLTLRRALSLPERAPR